MNVLLKVWSFVFFSIIFIVSYIHVQTNCPSLPRQSVTDMNLYAAGALRLQNTIWANLGLVWNVCETLLKEAAWWWLAPRLLFGGCPCVILNSFTLADYRHSSLSYFYNFSMPAALYCACCIHGWREKHAAGGACLHGTPGQFKQLS